MNCFDKTLNRDVALLNQSGVQTNLRAVGIALLFIP